jgi:hypothetical protein
MSSRRRRVDHRPSSIHRDLGWMEGIQSSPLAGSRHRHGVHALRLPHSTTQSHAIGSHVHRRLACRRRHPHGARQLRNQASPRRPQPHRSRSVGPPKTKAQARPRSEPPPPGASPLAGNPPRPRRRAKPVAEAAAPRRRRATRRDATTTAGTESPPLPCCPLLSAAHHVIAQKSAARPASRRKNQALARWRRLALTPTAREDAKTSLPPTPTGLRPAAPSGSGKGGGRSGEGVWRRGNWGSSPLPRGGKREEGGWWVASCSQVFCNICRKCNINNR